MKYFIEETITTRDDSGLMHKIVSQTRLNKTSRTVEGIQPLIDDIFNLYTLRGYNEDGHWWWVWLRRFGPELRAVYRVVTRDDAPLTEADLRAASAAAHRRSGEDPNP